MTPTRKAFFFNNTGFTLIEAIIAAMILFLVVAVGTFGLRSAADAVARIEGSVLIAEALPETVEIVKNDLDKGVINGKGAVNGRVSYSFSAKQIDSGPNITGTDLQSGELAFGTYTARLYEVEMSLIAQTMGGETERFYSYQELAWSLNSP